MKLTRRTHVLLDEDRHRLLRRKAEETGRSVGELIRDAVDRTFADEAERERLRLGRREDALAGFLAADPMPVEDWPAIEREIEQLHERGAEP